MDTRSHPVRDEWIVFLRSETTHERSAWMAEHLKACPECMKVFAAIEAPVRLLGRDFPPSRLPAPVQWLRLSRRIAETLRAARTLGTEIELRYPPGDEAAWFAAAALAVEQAQKAGTEIAVVPPSPATHGVRLETGKGCLVLTPAPLAEDESIASTAHTIPDSSPQSKP